MDILFLTHRLPYPPNRGDRIRSFHLLRFLAQHGRVSLGCLTDETTPNDSLAVLQKYCFRIANEHVGKMRWIHAAKSFARGRSATEGMFRSADLSRRLSQWAETTRFDAIVVFCSSMLQYAHCAKSPTTRLIVDLVDSDSQKWFDYAAASRGLRNWLWRQEGERVRRLEQSIPALADAITLVSTAEADLYRSYCPNDQTWAIGNGVDLDYYRPLVADAEQPRRCAFVGVLDYKPNVDGLLWFCRNAWPELRRRIPDATLAIIGRRPVAAILQLGDLPGVEVVGEVADIRPHVAAASVVIAPLQVARGVQNKVLEALAMARPVVASPQAIEGVALTPSLNVLRAASPQDWVDTLQQLLSDAALRRSMAASGRAFVETHHSWDVRLAPFATILGNERTEDAKSSCVQQRASTDPVCHVAVATRKFVSPKQGRNDE